MVKFAKLRSWSGALFAGFLAFSLLAASSMPLVCCPQDAATGVSNSVQIVTADQQADCDCLCVGADCACHHGVGFAKLADRPTFLAAGLFAEAVPAAYDPPPSAPQVQLLRPPRA